MDEHTEPPEPRKPRWPHWPGRLPSDDEAVSSQPTEALPDVVEPSGAADPIAAEPTAAQVPYAGAATDQPQLAPEARLAQPATAPEPLPGTAPEPQPASAGAAETGQGAAPPAAGPETVVASPADPLKSAAPETTVQLPPVPEQPVSEPAAPPDSVSEPAAPDTTAPRSGVPQPPAPDADGPQPDAQLPGVLEGEVLTEDEAAAARLKLRAERAVPDQRRLSPAALPAARQQLAEFVELGHRQRVPSLDDEIDTVSGEYVTTALVRSMAFVIRTHIMPGVVISQDQMTDVLLKVLAEPRDLGDAGDLQLKLPIAMSGGVISLDVSTGGGGGERPETMLVRPGERPEHWQPAEAEAEPEGAADFGSPDGSSTPAAEHHADAPGGPQTAAVIWGSAAAIADGSRYLGLDALMSYARDEIFEQIYRDTARSAARGMRAARDLEAIVLLDPSMGGGLWIDVDPDTGCPAATLAIELLSTVDDDGVRVTLLAGPQ